MFLFIIIFIIFLFLEPNRCFNWKRILILMTVSSVPIGHERHYSTVFLYSVVLLVCRSVWWNISRRTKASNRNARVTLRTSDVLSLSRYSLMMEAQKAYEALGFCFQLTRQTVRCREHVECEVESLHPLVLFTKLAFFVTRQLIFFTTESVPCPI